MFLYNSRGYIRRFYALDKIYGTLIDKGAEYSVQPLLYADCANETVQFPFPGLGGVLPRLKRTIIISPDDLTYFSL